MGHVHLSALDAFITFMYVAIIGFFWKMLAAHFSQSPLGQAMSVVY
jgi:hypothetical protein